MPIDLISNIQPAPGGAGLFPTHLDIYGAGGYQVRPTIASRDSIPPLNRKEGMVAYVVADTTEYRLNADLLTWTAVPSGGGGTLAGDVTGPSSANTVVRLTGAAGLVTVPTAALTFGADPSTLTSSHLRFSDNSGWFSWRSGGVNYRGMGALGSSMFVGGDAVGGAQPNIINYQSSNLHRFYFGTTETMEIGNNYVASGVQFITFLNTVASPTFGQAGRTTNAPPQTLTILTQQPWNDPTTSGGNNVPGSLRFDVGTPTNGASVYPNIFMRWSGTDRFTFGWSASGGPFISYGAMGALQPAASGLLRFPHSDIPFLITMRNAANLADLRIVSTNAADLIIFGDSAGSGGTYVQAGTGGVSILTAGISRALLQATSADHIDLGATPATIGYHRVPAATTTSTLALVSRDTTNSSDIALATVDTGNNTIFGGYGGVNSITAARTILTATAIIAFNPRNTSSLSGALAVDAYTLNWGEAATSPLLGQTTRTTDALPQNYTIRPQQPFTSATGANRTPGSLVLDGFGTPTNAGTVYGQILFTAAGATHGSFSYLGSNQFRLYGGPGGATDPYLQLSSAGTGGFVLKAGGGANNVIDYGAGGNLFIQASGTTYWAVTGGALYSYSGQFIVVEAPTSGAWTFTHSARTTNLNPINFTLTPQQPFSGGTPTTSSGKPGDFRLSIGAPVSPATAYGRFEGRTTANVTQWSMRTVLEGSGTNGVYLIGGDSTGTDGYLGLYTAAGWVISSNTASSAGTINAGNTVNVQIGASTKFTVATGGATFQVGVVSISTTSSADINFSTTVTAARMYQSQHFTDSPANNLTIQAQGAWSGATGTNLNGACVNIMGGARGTTAGRRTGARIFLGASDTIMFEAADVQAEATSLSRVLAVFHANNTSVTTGRMPTGTGDLVWWIGNRGTAPTVNANLGHIYYSENDCPAWRFANINLRLDTISSTASAGGGGTLPATVLNYLQVTINGTPVKIPYYAA